MLFFHGYFILYFKVLTDNICKTVFKVFGCDNYYHLSYKISKVTSRIYYSKVSRDYWML